MEKFHKFLSSKYFLQAVFVIIFLVLVALGQGIIKNKPQSPAGEFNLDLTPTATREVYKITHVANSPKFELAVIEPRDVKVGDLQKLTVQVSDPKGIKEVKAITDLDHSVKEISLTLVKGDQFSGYWHGEWLVEDTHSKTYHTKFIATNLKNETSNIVLAWSDPCTPPFNGNWTLDGNCSISGVSGVDNGNYTNVTYTLTIPNGATFVFNSGKSMTITSGAIAVATGGQIKQTNLWVSDNDGDHWYPYGAYRVGQDTQPTGFSRSYQIVGADDCNDSSASVWKIWYNIHRDADGDGYGADAVTNICGNNSMPSGYTSVGGDCRDDNYDVHPGQSNFFTYPFSGGYYDYNCDGYEERQFTTYGYCETVTHYPNWCGTPGYVNNYIPGCGGSNTWELWNGCDPGYGCYFENRWQGCR